MKTYIIWLLAILILALGFDESRAGTGAIPKGPDIFLLKQNLRFKGGDVKIMTNDTDDPTVVAKDADEGTAFIQDGSGFWFLKTDAGTTSNWASFVMATSTTSNIDECVPRWDGSGLPVFQSSVLCVDDAGIGTGLTQLDVANIRVATSSISTHGVGGNLALDPNFGGELVFPDLVGPFPAIISATGAVRTGLVDVSSMVTGILPIDNGGTATSTPLVDGRVMISDAGAITYSHHLEVFGSELRAVGLVNASSITYDQTLTTPLTASTVAVINDSQELDSSQITGEELFSLSGIRPDVQGQIDSKFSISGHVPDRVLITTSAGQATTDPDILWFGAELKVVGLVNASSITYDQTLTTPLTASNVPIIGASQELADSGVSVNELQSLIGVSAPIQPQIDSKFAIEGHVPNRVLITTSSGQATTDANLTYISGFMNIVGVMKATSVEADSILVGGNLDIDGNNIAAASGDVVMAADGSGARLFLEATGGIFATSALQVSQNLNVNASTVSTGTGDINISSPTGINLNSGTTTVNGNYSFPVASPSGVGETIVHIGGTETAWGNATNAVGFSATSVSSNVTLSLIHDTVFVDAALADVTVSLISATTFGCNGKMVNVQLVSSSGTRMIVDAPQTISGTSTVSAGLPGDSYTFRCDGSEWHLENYSEMIKRQMSCHLFNPAVGAPTADNDSGICSKWIQNVSANATVGDIEVRIMPGACSKPPACVAGVIDQSNYEWYVRHTASTLSKDLVVPHTFNPGVGNVDADMTLKCECLK